MNKTEQPRKALGRGLSSLLPSKQSPSQQPIGATAAIVDSPDGTGGYLCVKIDLIDPNPTQPRTIFEPEKLDELAASILGAGGRTRTYGETFCVIGENGSGKSTLLQIIAGILQPTSGKAAVHGRVSALLELGSGFNPEFTGRENVYLNAAILGFRPRADRPPATRRSRPSPRSATSSTSPSKPTRAAWSCASRSPSPSTSTPKSCSSTKPSPSATSTSASAACAKCMSCAREGRHHPVRLPRHRRRQGHRRPHLWLDKGRIRISANRPRRRQYLAAMVGEGLRLPRTQDPPSTPRRRARRPRRSSAPFPTSTTATATAAPGPRHRRPRR
jgi:energy-coupling factor transporter ATP-binding protein EcfA2